MRYMIMSHRRSGAHYLIHLLRENYGVNSTVRHLPPEQFVRKNKIKDKFICLVRDPRDVLVACYFYYKGFPFFKKKLEKLTIQDFIRGKLDVKAEDVDHKQHWTDDMMSDPIGHWVSFVTGWIDHGGFVLRYEDFNGNPQGLKIIEKRYNLNKKGKYKDHDSLVSPRARNKKIGEYKEFLTKDDNQLFIEKAGHLMKELNYNLGP